MTRLRRHAPRRRRDASRVYPPAGIALIVLMIAAVYVSYNANSGVPGERSRYFYVDLPNANRLVKTNQVRMAGVRIGQIAEVRAMPPSKESASSAPGARVRVKLPADAAPIPVDTVASVRPASVLGATYLDLRPGTSERTVEEDGLLPASQARSTVELTDLLDVFDERTARSVQSAATSIGNGLLARGSDLGETITGFRELAPATASLMSDLADDRTRLGPFIGSYERLIAAFGAEQRALGRGFENASSTFGAVERSRQDLSTAIEDLPATATGTTRALARLRPALDGLADISAQLRPGAEILPGGLSRLNDVLGTATKTFAGFRPVSPLLTTAAGRLRSFGESKDVDGALRKIGDAAVAGEPVARTTAEAQLHCNVVGMFGENLTSAFVDAGVGSGPGSIGVRIKSLGTSPLETLQNGTKLPSLHTNYTPNQNAQECEAGNEPFKEGEQVLSNPPGNQDKAYVETRVDPELTRQAESIGLLAPPLAPTGR